MADDRAGSIIALAMGVQTRGIRIGSPFRATIKPHVGNPTNRPRPGRMNDIPSGLVPRQSKDDLLAGPASSVWATLLLPQDDAGSFGPTNCEFEALLPHGDDAHQVLSGDSRRMRELYSACDKHVWSSHSQRQSRSDSPRLCGSRRCA
jgi:hypothetical protein